MGRFRDGPGAGPTSISVTTTAVEAKVGGSAQEERKVVALQPLDGDVFWGYDSGVTSSSGHKLYKDVYAEIQAATTLPIFLVAASGTVDVRVSEIS